MSPYLRKVKTASGATAVQVVVKDNGVRHIVEHLGSAHDEAEPAALMRLGHQRLLAGQQVLDLGPALDGGGQAPSHEPGDGGAVRRPAIISRRSGWLIETIKTAYTRLRLGEAVKPPPMGSLTWRAMSGSNTVSIGKATASSSEVVMALRV